MFEAKLPRNGEFRPLDDGAGDDRLRLLSWEDLVARLWAARELRTALHPPREVLEGSFDAESARLIAAHHNGKHAINSDASRNFKADDRTSGSVGLGFEPGVQPAPRGSK